MKTKFGDYQTESRKTYADIAVSGDVVYPTLGLVNEAGEFAGKLKKVYRDKDGHIDPETHEMMKHELGDVLWYLTQICTNLGMTLEEIAEANLVKLFDRLDRGTIRGDGDNR